MSTTFFREKIFWRINRLRCMSLSEIWHRIHEAARAKLQRHGALTARRVPAAEANDGLCRWLSMLPTVAPAPYIKAAATIADGWLDLFALHRVRLGRPPCWNRAPYSGTEFPVSFGLQLNYRSLGGGADIKYVWEPNRHLQLVTIAQAYALTGSQEHLEALRLQIESWLDQCPYLLGPNWCSSLEAGIRLINWSIAWQLIGGGESLLFAGAAGADLRDRWLVAIFQHMHFIRHRFSRYSSANNHLIGEAAGLFVAAMTWPIWPDVRVWCVTARSILDREVLLQNAPDGGNREQAFAYQQFVLSFLLVAGLAARSGGADFGGPYWVRVEAMLEFIASVMDTGGNVPMVGDADDGLVMRLSQETDWCSFRSLLATGAVLFRRRDFCAKAGRLDEQTVWLLGDSARETFSKLNAEPVGLPVRRSFPDSGYCILGDRFETSDEVRVVADAGPIGYLSIAAHGHADALSITLSVGGKEFLVDPGTYAYNTERKWRDYFRGTTAHNTACVDGANQSEAGGNFIWLRKAKSMLESWRSDADSDVWIASHDGYQRLDDPVVHRRTLHYAKTLQRLTVTDEISCAGLHKVDINWHFSEQCDVRESEGRLRVSRDGHEIALEMRAKSAVLSLWRGNEERPAGWVSRRFGLKTPAWTANWHAEIVGPASFVTVIDVEGTTS